MIVAYHCIISAYGFWLPNDPRGSWSDWVHSWELFRAAGPASRVSTRRSVAADPHDARLRAAGTAALRFPPVTLTGRQALGVAMGFAEAAAAGGFAIHACAIMPQHAHVILGRHPADIRERIGRLKRYASLQLFRRGLHPFQDYPGEKPTMWADGGWSVYLDPSDMERAIRYVENNPAKEALRPQHWSFVTPWSG